MVNHICPECGYTTNRKSSYENHLHKRKNPCKKPIEILCNVCNAKFARADSLKRHLVTCTSQEPIHNTTSAHGSLANTKETSISLTNNDNYKCNYCDKLFVKKNNLNKHVMCCKSKLEITNQKEEIFKKLLAEVKELKEQNKILQKIDITQNITQNYINFNITRYMELYISL